MACVTTSVTRWRSCLRAELLVLAGDLDAMAVLVEAQAAPQGLGEVELRATWETAG